MMKLLIILSLFFNTNAPTSFSKAEQEKCNTAKDASYLNQIEKDVIYYINLVRLNPQKFEKSILSPYLKENPEYSRKHSKSLIRDLKKEKTKAILAPTKKLYDFANHHAKTTGKKGRVGHKSVKGKNYEARSKHLLDSYTYVGENIHYGANNALEIVIDLLVDDGVKDKGHRENILFSEFRYCSASLQPHKKYKYNCVMDFGGKKK